MYMGNGHCCANGLQSIQTKIRFENSNENRMLEYRMEPMNKLVHSLCTTIRTVNSHCLIIISVDMRLYAQSNAHQFLHSRCAYHNLQIQTYW